MELKCGIFVNIWKEVVEIYLISSSAADNRKIDSCNASNSLKKKFQCRKCAETDYEYQGA
jgi:hypothetical protein